jgi:hypothetical protein
MRTNALLVSLVCLAACNYPWTATPPEPVDSRPWCERIDYGWATPSESEPSEPAPSAALLGFTSIDRAWLREPILESRWATRRCYQLALELDPNLRGRLVVSFVIHPDGHMTAIEVLDDTLADPCVGHCVVEVGKRLWSFSPTHATGTTTVHYPFLFESYIH